MVSWTPPMWYVVLRNHIGLLVAFYIVDIIEMYEWGLIVVLIMMALSTLIVGVGYLAWMRRIGKIHDHELSFWWIGHDAVLRKLAQAMVARGAKPPLEKDGKRVWFLLPPLSIVVEPGWLRTKVYVGPSTDETETTVKRLKGFVEQTLA